MGQLTDVFFPNISQENKVIKLKGQQLCKDRCSGCQVMRPISAMFVLRTMTVLLLLDFNMFCQHLNLFEIMMMIMQSYYQLVMQSK